MYEPTLCYEAGTWYYFPKPHDKLIPGYWVLTYCWEHLPSQKSGTNLIAVYSASSIDAKANLDHLLSWWNDSNPAVWRYSKPEVL